MIRVVDASVALKWFVEEDGSRQASALLSGADTLIAPDLIIAEACNAAWKATRMGLMHPSQQASVANRLPAILDEVLPSAPLAPRATVMANLLDHPVYDCFYLALAEQRAGKLITADQRLVRRLATTMWADMVEDLR